MILELNVYDITAKCVWYYSLMCMILELNVYDITAKCVWYYS